MKNKKIIFHKYRIKKLLSKIKYISQLVEIGRKHDFAALLTQDLIYNRYARL